MNEEGSKKFKATIGVFSHEFQGPFSGELVNQIKQHCVLRNIRVIGFCTGSLGEYNCELNIDQLDGAIVVRNSISIELAERLLARGVALASISYDYFPLDIPVVDINNNNSMDIVFDYLKERGHSTISFVGNLKNYDARKRYERYLELLEKNALCFADDLLIHVNKSDFSGGIDAGNEFLRRGCNSTAIITESSDITIGFVSALRENQIYFSDVMEIVGYGATPLMPVLCPNITTVDQNLHLMAYRAVFVVTELLSGNPVNKDSLFVTPKLIRKEDFGTRVNSPYLATSVDINELYEPNYVAGLINSNFYWSWDIFESDLEKLMSVAPVFEKYMKEAVYSKIYDDHTGMEVSEVIRHFTVSKSIQTNQQSKKENICTLHSYPPLVFNRLRENYLVINHFFIFFKDKPRAVLSIYGDERSLSRCSSYLFFAGQMEAVTRLCSLKMECDLLQRIEACSGESSADLPQEVPLHPIIWDLHNHITEWSKEALSILAITSPFDVNIYRNMDIADRIHNDDIGWFKPFLVDSATQGKGFCSVIRLKNRHGKYVPIALQAEAIKEGEKIVALTFMICYYKTEV